MSANISDLFHLHFIVLVLGFTGVLGRLISISAFELVWYRMALSSLGMLVWLLFTKQLVVPTVKQISKYLLTGSVVALHWICFFGSIKASTVSVALACFAATTLFVSLIEPLLGRRKISYLELVLGVVIIGALLIIFKFETHYYIGIVLGVLAALLGAVFMVLNKQFQLSDKAVTITLYEMIGGFLTLSLFIIPYASFESLNFTLQGNDLLWILILAFVCTCYAFMASIKVMRSLSAYQVVLTINLEPVYGIILAYIVYKDAELMTPQFYLGTLILVFTVILYSIIKKNGLKFWRRGKKINLK